MEEARDPDAPGQSAGPSSLVDDLVEELRARVEARRSAGAYPDGLEDQMSAHFQRILQLRRGSTAVPDATVSVQAVGQALPIQAAKIPLGSGVPGGEVLHKTVARLVGRQTQGALQQVQAFAQPVYAALEDLNAAVRQLTQLVTADVAQSLDVLYEHQAAQDRLLAAAGLTPASVDEPLRRSSEDTRERRQVLVDRLIGCDPVLAIGVDDGEFTARLEQAGVETEHAQVEAAVQHLRTLDEHKALGALLLVLGVERFSPQEIVDVIALAGEKVRPGGHVFIETFGRHSVHPAYLVFLLRESGFGSVEVEWCSAPPVETAKRLHELLYAPRGCLITAVR